MATKKKIPRRYLLNLSDSKKKIQMENLSGHSVYPYVGIIQIRLRVETKKFPLSRLKASSPVFIYGFIIQPEVGDSKKKFCYIENRMHLCYSVMEYIRLEKRSKYHIYPEAEEENMKVSTLLEGLEYTCCQGSTEQEVTTVVYDSRKVEENSLFICIRGAVVDGHKFVPDVIEKGAKTLIVEEEVEAPSDVTVIKVADTRYAMAFISAAYFGHPAKELKTIGITGTKGKTTTTYMVKSILENAGYKVGLIGTIEAIIGDKHIPAHNTTPESSLVQEYFRKMADAGCDCVVMEVSSQGLMLHRTQGFVFDYGIFTNIEPDHIGPNEHKDFDDYLRCKSMLLRQCKVGIVNRDDEHFERIIEGHTCTLETYGFSPEADLRAEDAHMVGGRGYLGISYQLKGLMEFPVEIDIPGKFSIYNSLTAIAICRHFNVSQENIIKALKVAKVKGWNVYTIQVASVEDKDEISKIEEVLSKEKVPFSTINIEGVNKVQTYVSFDKESIRNHLEGIRVLYPDAFLAEVKMPVLSLEYTSKYSYLETISEQLGSLIDNFELESKLWTDNKNNINLEEYNTILTNRKTMVKNIEKEVSKIDYKGAEVFKSNLTTYLNNVDKNIEEASKSANEQNYNISEGIFLNSLQGYLTFINSIQ